MSLLAHTIQLNSYRFLAAHRFLLNEMKIGGWVVSVVTIAGWQWQHHYVLPHQNINKMQEAGIEILSQSCSISTKKALKGNDDSSTYRAHTRQGTGTL